MPTIESAPATASLMLEQTRVIHARRALVYEAWTNPEVLQQWFGAPAMHCPSAKLNVEVGGAYRIDVHSKPEAASRQALVTGHFTKIVPNELLQFTWSASWSPDEESLVTVSLKDVPDGTEITIRHERFASEASRDAHNQGWAGAFDKLTSVAEQL
jgi:uncharacterized protein YndB with AHSA1/START domain